jgi:hypothetical protein
MKKNKVLVVIVLLTVTSLSSCGIFHKGCGCPTFGEAKPIAKFENLNIC